jgi:predicted lipoprotein
MHDSDRFRAARLPRNLRSACVAAGLATVLASACRKAEPDEVVSPPRQEPSAGGAFGFGGSSGGQVGQGGATGSGTGGTEAGGTANGGTGAAGGDSGTTTRPVECDPVAAALEPPFTKSKLIESSGSCAMSHYCRFTVHAQTLRDASRALVQTRSEETLGAVRSAWVAAISSWEEAEVFNFGPAGRSGESGVPGGQDLRNLIYSWPVQARCKVDEQTVSRFYATEEFSGSPAISLVNGRSLAALEYLLFYEGTDNGCTQFSEINARGTWKALSPDELVARKAEYAVAAAEDVLTSSVRLVNAWEPSKGNFRSQLVSAGAGSEVFQTEQQALNAINVGLFYVEKELKDDKLGTPMGLSEDCPAMTCPDRLESRYARISTDHLRANLRGFRRLFQGCGENNTGIGFDDWLREVGNADLADRMLAALDNAERAVAALDPPIEQSITAYPDRVDAMYAAIKGVTNLLKTEFITTLNLEVPGPSIGDND